MTENMKKLLELASVNEEFKDKMNAASKEELIALAKEHGLTLTEADFDAPTGELSDDELDAVSGGNGCGCTLGGGGKGAGFSSCVCVGGGAGLENGTKKTRCVCAIAGMGW